MARRIPLPALFAGLLFALFSAAPARAQAVSTDVIPSHPALSDSITFDIGAFYSRSSTQASLGVPAGGFGAVVDFESTLGLDERNLSGIAGLVWRITDRWRFEAEYNSLKRKAERPLATEVVWGDIVFPEGVTVDSTYNFLDVRASGGYSFFKRQDKEIGVGFGVHVAGIRSDVEAAGVGTETADVLAPLPVLNFFGTFALTDDWAIRMRADWLSLSYDIYSGDLRTMSMDLAYMPFRHVGFGVGVRTFVLDVEIDDADWRGRARTSFTGPNVFVIVSF